MRPYSIEFQGVINAGEFLGLFSCDEAMKVIDDAHLKVFGVTKEQRKAHKEDFKSAIKNHDGSFFDVPTIERRTNENIV